MEKPNVLYVDDEEINLEMLKITFQNEFEILTAISAARRSGEFYTRLCFSMNSSSTPSRFGSPISCRS
jgi:hypothetical protein